MNRANGIGPCAATPLKRWSQCLALALSLLALCSAGAWAQGQSFPPGGQSPVPGGGVTIVPGGSTPINMCGPGGQTPGQPGCTEAAGNPLNVMAGNKYQREADMPALPGVLGLELVRHYNSDFSALREGTSASVSPVGRGWRLGYDGWLRLPEGAKGKRLEPGEIPADETITFSGPDGSQMPLRHLSGGAAGASQWAPAGGGGLLLQIDPSNEKTPYVLRTSNGLQRHFDARGRQVRIQAASGHAVRIERDEHGRITRVSDPQGRQLVLHYPEPDSSNGSGNNRVIRQAQHIDTPLGRYSYHFGREAHAIAAQTGVLISLAQSQAQASSLMRVRRPDGSERHYHHEDASLFSLLTGISVRTSADAPLQREVSWAYDAMGRAIRSVKGPMPAEGQRGPQDVSLQFLGPQGSQRRDGSGVTILSNSLGEETRYEYQMLGGQRQLTLVQGAGCSSCGPTNVRYGHDSLGRQVSITELSPVRVENGQIQGQAQPLSQRRLSLDAQGRILRTERIRYQAGREVGKDLIEERSYGDARWPHHPTLIARPSVVGGQEHRIGLSYNAAGQITELKESGFSPLDAEGRLPQQGQPGQALERTSRYRYQTIGGHSVLIEADGALPNGPQNDPTDSDITRYQWDESGHRILAITHPMGLIERFEYEALGDNPSARVLARTDVLGVRTELNWAPHAMRVRQVRRAGVQVDIGHDSQGRVSRYRRNDGAQIEVAYDDAQGLVRYTLPDGEVREIRHDSEGRPITRQSQDASGQVLVGQQQIEYGALDAQGLREIRITDASGVLTRLRQDPLNGQHEIQHGQGEGQLSQSERFDAAQHLLQVQRNEATTRLQSDQRDASASLELPHGATHRQWRDDFGRTVRIEHPDSGVHRAAYDEADRQTARWDSSRHSSARYDALGRLIQLRHANTDGAGIQTASATVRAVVEAEEETTWHYQGALLVRQTSNQQDKHFDYNANGQLIEERLSLRRQSQDTNTTEWLPELVTRYQRDGFGRIARIHLPEGAVLSQRHNPQGRIEAVSLQEPANQWWQRAIRWVWAEHGARELVGDIQHSSTRGLRGYSHGNGNQASSTHDQAARLTLWQDGPQRSELTYNEHAQLATLKTASPERPGPTREAALALKDREQQLRYDPFGRLRQVQEGPLAQAFEYDANGNRLGQSSPTLGSLRYVLAGRSDRLLAVENAQGQGHRRYHHNSAGEPILIESDGGQRTLHYDAQGQIGAVEEGEKLLARYAYNGARQRVAKTVYGEGAQDATTYFTWHRGLLDAELDEHGRVQRRYIYLNLRAVALLEYGYGDNGSRDSRKKRPESTQRYAIHGDHLGTPQAITDGQQRVVWLAGYDVFGRASAQGLPRSELTAQNRSRQGKSWIGTAHAAGGPDKPFEFHLRFAGQYEDSETGWHYNWHRYYEPEIGRYLTPDPIGLRGGDNAYGYAGGDPLGALDPDGLLVVISGHRAAGVAGAITSPDSYHLSVVLIPDNPADFLGETGWQEWSHGDWAGANENHQIYLNVGGQPQGFQITSWPFTGNLVTQFNYPDDGPSASTWHQIVLPPTGMSDTEFIRSLIGAARGYSCNQPYSFPDIFPGGQGFLATGRYNSNSYVAGLFNHVLGAAPSLNIPGRMERTLGVNYWVYDFQVPGYHNPLPMQ